MSVADVAAGTGEGALWRLAARVCPVTKLLVNRDSERLVQWNAVVAIVYFLVGVSAALLLALTRWQAVHLLSPLWYYRMLTLHGLDMLIFFIIFFEMAILYFAGPILLNCRQPAPKTAWSAFGLMLAGSLLVNAVVLAGRADVLFTSYVPLKAHPLYYLGIILFAVGALIATLLFFAALVVAKRERTYPGSIPLVTFGALTAAVIAVITLLHGAIIYVPTLLWSIDEAWLTVDPQLYRMIWWGLGHSSQQINVAAMVGVWYLMGALTIGAVVLNQKISRWAFVLYVLFISMASAHHLLVDPGMGPAWKVWNTSYAMYLAVLASMIHGFTVPAGMEIGMRLRGFDKGRFQWLSKAPWSDPGFSGTFLSLVIFGFLGGITGVTQGTEQINIIVHNTLRVPGHFHATVVGGTALAFMALTYYVIPLVFKKRVAFWKLARWQPYLFAIGIVTLSMSMTFAGSFGVPRRHADITFPDAPFGLEFPAGVDLFMAGVGLGGTLAVLAVLAFIAIAVVSICFGKPLDLERATPATPGIPQGVFRLPPQIHDAERSERMHRQGAPGTVILAFVFLAVFVLYYFTNWKILSLVWKIG
jgi:cytochrome c oxidase subunit 1